ncbi:DNA-deoxyinosine glycosylase [Nitrincola alkalilacustris]|uniref:DNA-deoxyinosine glycosylase n=1 Tax=Nitrincola alkalilacustris TaxID=1571224 RepID=UPI00124C91E4|nr:DNA-deoxyinosine glycosylase [Nitrincola alkalilacustris]
MTQIYSFPPIEPENARILILGSMPGVASLKAQQYYAHPRNAFWPIMGELFGAHPELPYHERVEILKAEGIAVWDVLESCVRVGSLDASIDSSSLRVNDFSSFFRRHPQIRHVFFNGAKAEQSFRRHALPELRLDYLSYTRLPSTSPAHAAMSFDSKLNNWSKALLR